MVQNFELHHGVVLLDYFDLVNDSSDLTDAIALAFGNSNESLGICLVKNVPDLTGLRENLLTDATELADLSQQELDSMVDPESTFMFGWSHGREMFDGKPDFAKGSFYNNPVFDSPPNATAEKTLAFPAYYRPNIWPASMPRLKSNFMNLGQLIVGVGKLVAKHCDIYINRMYPELPKDFIRSMIDQSVIHKARLLHYFPMDDTSKPNDWCGLHLDHSGLTGLTSAMYVDTSTGLVTTGNDESGLYIKTRQGALTKITFPPQYLAFQLGEASQIASQGLLVATPHLVKVSTAKNIARNTFAVFMQPNVDFELKSGYDFAKFTADTLRSNHA